MWLGRVAILEWWEEASLPDFPWYVCAVLVAMLGPIRPSIIIARKLLDQDARTFRNPPLDVRPRMPARQIHLHVLRLQRECLRISVTSFQSRSEEHTSELQSLMRLSYAVFC